MAKLQIIKLALCGPSDVEKETDYARKAIEDWNRLHGEVRGLTIKAYHWSTDTFPDAMQSGQGAVNDQIIDDAQIIVAIFWSRIGTPTAAASSGTVEEIRRGVSQKRKVLVYFSNLEPLPANADERQLEELWQFRQELRATSSCWSFQSRSQFREDFISHLALAMNLFVPSPQKRRRSPASASAQKIKGNGNVQIHGDGNQVNNYQHPPTIKNVIERRADSITSEQEFQITEWINELAEGTIGKTRDQAYGHWGARFLKRFKITKREALSQSKMGDAEKWYRQQRAIQKSGYKAKAPDQWRSSRIKAIKSAMGAMGKEKAFYYPELSKRLKMAKPFVSITKLTKVDLKRVYDMVLGDARKDSPGSR